MQRFFGPRLRLDLRPPIAWPFPAVFPAPTIANFGIARPVCLSRLQVGGCRVWVVCEWASLVGTKPDIRRVTEEHPAIILFPPLVPLLVVPLSFVRSFAPSLFPHPQPNYAPPQSRSSNSCRGAGSRKGHTIGASAQAVSPAFVYQLGRPAQAQCQEPDASRCVFQINNPPAVHAHRVVAL